MEKIRFKCYVRSEFQKNGYYEFTFNNRIIMTETNKFIFDVPLGKDMRVSINEGLDTIDMTQLWNVEMELL